jgi:hypothetical protein
MRCILFAEGSCLKQGSLRLDAPLGKLNGEIVVDAASGESGSGMRDRKNAW